MNRLPGLAVDVGGTQMRVALIDPNRRIIRKESVLTDAAPCGLLPVH